MSFYHPLLILCILASHAKFAQLTAVIYCKHPPLINHCSASCRARPGREGAIEVKGRGGGGEGWDLDRVDSGLDFAEGEYGGDLLHGGTDQPYGASYPLLNQGFHRLPRLLQPRRLQSGFKIEL